MSSPEPGEIERAVQGIKVPPPEKTKPWKYLGYNAFTAFMAADQDAFAVRRFDRLHTRAILSLQDRLVESEEKLDAMDAHFSSRHVKITCTCHSGDGVSEHDKCSECGEKPRDINNGTIRDDMPDRAALVDSIVQMLEGYDNLLLGYSRMRSLPNPAPYVSANISTWLKNHKGAIDANEAAFISHIKDLVSLSESKSSIRRLFEQRLLIPLRHAIQKKDENADHHVITCSDDIVDNIATGSMLLCTTGLFLTPMWVLQALADSTLKLVVITAFAIAWLGFLSASGFGKPAEKLAAMAGYIAVLVVFLQVETPGEGSR